MQTISDILGYKFIDIHSHFDHGVEGDSGAVRDIQTKNLQLEDLDFSFSQHKGVGIEVCGYSTFSSVLSSVRVAEENEYLYELVKREPHMRQWVVVHPEIELTFRQAEKMLESPLTLGIKIHPPCHGYSILDKYERIFDLANRLSATVLMHPDSISRMPELCDNYPRMRLIIAHVGSEDHVQAVKRSKAENIFLDTSGGASNLNNVIEYATETVGAEKILFGTDTYSAAFQTGRIAFARISDEAKRKILRDNAIRMFPRAFSKI